MTCHARNGWTVAEHAGDATPDRTQRLLNHAVWDTERAAGVVRGFVVEHLAPGAELTVGALDESGIRSRAAPRRGRNGSTWAAPGGSRTGSTPCTARMSRRAGTHWPARWHLPEAWRWQDAWLGAFDATHRAPPVRAA